MLVWLSVFLAGISWGLGLRGWAQGPPVLEVGRFSTEAEGGLPQGWTPLTFPKVARHTTYTLVKDRDTVVVKAVSQASASGLIKAVRLDPREYPILRWRWKIEHLLKTADITTKNGDDYPVRLYITFEYDPAKIPLRKRAKYLAAKALLGDIPIAALNYVWDAKAPQGLFIDNAYTDFAKMVVVRSGSTEVGRWVEEERNVYEDYRVAFGGDPPAINGVAIMSDTDNTGESAVAYYGDIVFLKARPELPGEGTR
jgi:hypothetical protein